MPPKTRITKEKIINASLTIIRREGIIKLNARAIAKELKCSTQPIFGFYATMEELKEDVIKTAGEHYALFFDEHIKRQDVPPYKASGLAYIQFAKDERELFKLLFMRDRTTEQIKESEHSYEIALKMIMTAHGFEREDAEIFHLQMWIYVHGIASLIVTSYLNISDELISEIMTRAFLGTLYIIKENGKRGCRQ